MRMRNFGSALERAARAGILTTAPFSGETSLRDGVQGRKEFTLNPSRKFGRSCEGFRWMVAELVAS